MLLTKPDFINGDHLSLREYLVAVMNDKRMLFSSRWIWWKKVTTFWVIPLLVADVTLFVALLYQEIKAGEGIDWFLIASMMVIPFICILPFVWAGNYYYSWISPRKISQKLEHFLQDSLSDATHVRRIAHNNYALSWNGLEFEIAYSLIPMKKNARGVPSHFRECFLICMYYVPDPNVGTDLVDENGEPTEQLLSDLRAYCEGKDSCKYMYIEKRAVFAFLPLCEWKDREQAHQTMEQIQYISHRFKLLPLYMSQLFSESIKNWLNSIDQPIADDIKAINIGAFQTTEGYALYLIGSTVYDPDNDDWACNEDFVPEEKYFEVPLYNLGSTDWMEFQELVKKLLEDYVATKAEDEHSLFYHRTVTIGFDDGDLQLIRKYQD